MDDRNQGTIEIRERVKHIGWSQFGALDRAFLLLHLLRVSHLTPLGT